MRTECHPNGTRPNLWGQMRSDADPCHLQDDIEAGKTSTRNGIEACKTMSTRKCELLNCASDLRLGSILSSIESQQAHGHLVLSVSVKPNTRKRLPQRALRTVSRRAQGCQGNAFSVLGLARSSLSNASFRVPSQSWQSNTEHRGTGVKIS